MSKPLKVLFLASEADPYMKVGGLGDVAGSLPIALRALPGEELDVRLVIPFHKGIQADQLSLQRETVFTLSRQGGVEVPVQVFRTELHGMPVYLISGAPISGKPYESAGVDGEKYIYFSLAALELCKRIDWRPDIVHANDWHTAASLYGVKLRQDDPFWRGVKTVFTVHNLGYMGAEAEDALLAYGLPPLDEPLYPMWACRQPMPIGLWASDSIVAVSPSYAQEIQTPEYGYGLDPFLRSRRKRITGIVNGIDTTLWDPVKDETLAVNFGEQTLALRTGNKAALQTQFNLERDPSVPLMAMVTRMDQQKGVDITLKTLRLITDEPWQVILLGTGNSDLENAARRLEADFPSRVCAALRFDAKLSRQLYGGADMFLMPSRYEPCGLAQMIAMRYGAVPVARATGGLRDTIAESRTGFLFTDASSNVMAAALRRAMQAFQNRAKWQEMQVNAMREDFSWQKSAEQYASLYQKLTS
jgi:starch synthase